MVPLSNSKYEFSLVHEMDLDRTPRQLLNYKRLEVRNVGRSKESQKDRFESWSQSRRNDRICEVNDDDSDE
jgi:hypothetical protein